MIIVRLRESDLVSAGACSEGIALFRSIIGQPEKGETGYGRGSGLASMRCGSLSPIRASAAGCAGKD